MATIKKAQGGGLIKKAIKAASNTAPKVEKELSVFQKMRLAKGKPLTHFNMDEQKASGALNKAINSRTNPEAAVKKMTKAQRQAKEIEDSYKKNGGAVKKAQEGKMITNSREVNPWEKDTTGLGKATKELQQISKKRSPIGKSIKSADYKPSMRKYKNGGSLSGLKASNKRVGPVDPKGAYTTVQKRTLAGAKGKASLTKDKQLGATKMAKSGAKVSKKK